MNETWRLIENFTNYEVSSLGRVRNIKTGEIRKLQKDKDGYSVITLRNSGKLYLLKIHRLVAQAFIPNPNNYSVVNHKNECKTDNSVENLEWCTVKYNNNYGTAIQRRSLKRTNDIRFSKKVYQYDLSGNFIKEFPSMRQVERELGIRNECISRCCKGKYKSTGGFIFKYNKL